MASPGGTETEHIKITLGIDGRKKGVPEVCNCPLLFTSITNRTTIPSLGTISLESAEPWIALMQ